MGLSNLTGQVLDEKYRIDKELGRGGMGAVYLATHLGTERPVALKVIAPQFMMQNEFVERFRREARAAGRMHHPNVVNVTDFGFARVDSQRVAYLVMEYLDGCALADVLAEESRLPLGWVVDIIEQACSALDEAHRQGIIHRDLKPDNIWLEPNRRGGYTVKVLDFGLAKLADSSEAVGDSPDPADGQSGDPGRTLAAFAGQTDGLEAVTHLQSPGLAEEEKTQILVEQTVEPGGEAGPLEAATRIQPTKAREGKDTRAVDYKTGGTRVEDNRTIEGLRAGQTGAAEGLTRTGSILGTPLYMSPEQCNGKPLDARSDIYSLGVIAYQMLAGQTPFKGGAYDVLKQHTDAPPPPIRSINPKVPKKAAQVVMSALAKDPAERPASAAAFASALRAGSEVTGDLLRRAFAIYSEHFPKFFRISVLLHIPMIAITVIQHTAPWVAGRLQASTFLGTTISASASVVSVIVNFFAASVITGMTILLVTQLIVAPLRPVKVRLAFKTLKRRLWPLIYTGVMATVLALLGLLLLIIPGVIIFISFSLYAPVVIMENLKGFAALRRSKALVKRTRLTVTAVLFIQWAIPSFTSLLVFALFGSLFKAMEVPKAPEVAGRVAGIITVMLNVLLVPLISTFTALLYLKARQIGGETLKEVLSRFEEEDVPSSKWQMRMRERLQSSSHPSR